MNDQEQPKTIAEALKLRLYYVLIGVVSFIALAFLPFIGSNIGLKWAIPDTTAGWVVWAATRLIISVINVLMFHCFMEQAKINIRENENYKKANELLQKTKKKERPPRSPRKWNAEQYGKKGTSIFLASALATVALTQAILTFDWIALLTYLFTIVLGVIFGVIQMKRAELYWTTEYYDYAVIYAAKEEECETNTTK